MHYRGSTGMLSEAEIEVYRSHRASQERYTYFMLAAAGAAIAFAVTRSQDMALRWSEVPLALAVLSWGISLFTGFMQLRYVESNLLANLDLLKIVDGRHPKVGNYPQVIEVAGDGLREAMNANSTRARNYGLAQFYCLIAGGVSFITWDVLEMYLRT